MAFSFTSHKYHVYYNHDDGTRDPQPITRITFNQIINKAKDECKGVAWGLVFKLEKRIPKIWGDDYLGCHLPPILDYKYSKG
jgi:hypothetical protein